VQQWINLKCHIEKGDYTNDFIVDATSQGIAEDIQAKLNLFKALFDKNKARNGYKTPKQVADAKRRAPPQVGKIRKGARLPSKVPPKSRLGLGWTSSRENSC
jgi:hypothetical protein